MSLFKSIGKVIGKVAGAAAPFVGAVNPTFGAVAGTLGSMGARSVGAGGMSQGMLMPAAFPSMMGSLPALGRLGAGAVLGAGARLGVSGIRRIASSAARYCRTNPGWCATVGGIAGVEALINSGQLPVHKHRRGRGLTSREMRSFRKVHKVLSGFCAPRMRIRRKQQCR